VPVKKGDPEFIFYFLHGTGQRRLRKMKIFGCGRQRAGTSESIELFKQIYFNHYLPSFHP
jgi:hypothetical protein